MVSLEWSEGALAHADELEQAGQCRQSLEGVGNLPRKRSWRLWILTSLVTSITQPLRKQAPGGRWKQEVEGKSDNNSDEGRDNKREISSDRD